MSITLGGTNPAVTFPDGTIQNTSANLTAPYTSNGVVYASSTTALSTGSALTFDGTNFGVGTAGNAISNQIVNYKGGANANYVQVACGSTGIGATNGLRIGVSSAGLGEIYLQSSSPSMVFDTSGKVGIGTSSPAAILHVSTSSAEIGRFNSSSVNGGYLSFQTSGTTFGYFGAGATLGGGSSTDTGIRSQNNITFMTGGGNEAMRINSSGQLFQGTTSAIGPSSGGFMSQVFDGNAYQGIVLKTSNTSSGSTFMLFANSAGTTQGYITATTTSTTSYIGTSDQRLKENIVDAPSFLETINQLQVRQFVWKENGDTDIGFIAQELHTKLPKAVAVGIDNEDGSIQRPWGVDKSAIVPYLVKAIQEQQALIQSLITRLTALENK